MERSIEFFNLYYKENDMYGLVSTADEIKKTFINLLVNSFEQKEYMLKMYKDDKEPSIVLEIIEANDSFIFGLLGKLDDLSKKTLIRIRGKGIDEIHNTSSAKDLEYYIENFTYFYIRFNDLCCAVLKNNSAPSFKSHFLNLINDVVPYRDKLIDEVSIVPRIESNISDKISKFKNILNISLAFHTDKSLIGSDLVSFNDFFELSQSPIEYANMDITLKKEVNKKKIKDKLSSLSTYNDFNKFKIVGIDEDNAIQCIDAVEKLLTKRRTIDIEERYLMTSDGEHKIKEALISALPLI